MRGPSIGARRILLVAIVAANATLELSSAVGDWWGRSTGSSASLPPVVRDIVEGRPETSEGDVHLVMWFVAAAVLVLTARRWWQRLIGLGAMRLCTGLLEILQSTFTRSRSGQWSDVIANALGIAAAGVAMAIVDAIRSRRRARGGPSAAPVKSASAKSRPMEVVARP